MIALLLVNSCSGFAQETQHEQHFFLVDVSGSMDANPPRSKFSHLEIRKQELKEWFAAHSTSSVTLMTFFAKIDPEEGVKYDLGTSLNEANKWADRLTIQTRGGTHLWNCLRAVLTRVSEIAVRNPDTSVTVHVFTDGIDTERKSSLDQVIGDFPYARTVPMPLASQELGDFDVKVTKAITAKPTVSASSSVGPPSQPATNEREKVRRDSSGAAENVAFEIQEPRIVSSLQVVSFLNKTSPPADSYAWIIRHNLPRLEESKIHADGWWKTRWRKFIGFFGFSLPKPAQAAPSTQSAPEETEVSAEHLVYRFESTDSQPQSYSVRLFAKYGSKTIAATPLPVLVQAPQAASTSWDKFITWITGLFASGSLVPIAMDLLKLWGPKKSDRSGEDLRKSKNRLWIECGVAALFLMIFVLFGWRPFRPSAHEEAVAAEKSKVDAAANVQAISRSSVPVVQSPPFGQVPTVPTNIITLPNERPSKETINESTSLASPTPLTIALLIGIVAMLGLILTVVMRREKRSSSENLLNRPMAVQLDEIDRLAKDEIISKKQVRAFKNAIIQQMRKQYGILPKPRHQKSRRKPKVKVKVATD